MRRRHSSVLSIRRPTSASKIASVDRRPTSAGESRSISRFSSARATSSTSAAAAASCSRRFARAASRRAASTPTWRWSTCADRSSSTSSRPMRCRSSSARRTGASARSRAIQVVEHFDPAYLVRFLDAAFHKMKPGAPLVLETINPACWMAFFETYIRDLTHQRPLHPDTLRYLVEASGFSSVDVRFRQPVSEGDRLEHGRARRHRGRCIRRSPRWRRPSTTTRRSSTRACFRQWTTL